MSEIFYYCAILIIIGIGFFTTGKFAAGISCVSGGALIIGCALIAMALNKEE